MGEQKRVALYARYSSDMQRTESITAQIRAMEEFCKQHNWTVVAKYIDEARSATTDQRPQFLTMIEDSSNGAFDIVLVHKLDRFSRNRYDSAIYKSRLKKNGISVCSVLERIDDTPESIILESVLEGLSEYYSRNLGREVMKGMKETAYQCMHCGGSPPLGYNVDKDGYLAINQHEAEAVILIFQMYIDGYKLQEIADFLNQHGYRTKADRPFVTSSFLSILLNEKYTGTFVFNRVVAKSFDHKRNSHRSKPEQEIIRIPNCCPVIIPKVIFQRAQEIRKRGKNPNGSHKAKVVYICSGIIRCGVCSKNMTGSQRVVPKFYTYTCTSPKAECNNIKEIDKDKLDEYALYLVRCAVENIDKSTLSEEKRQWLHDDLCKLRSLNSTDKHARGIIQVYLKSVVVGKRRVTFTIDTGLDIDESVTCIKVSRNNFLTPPQQKRKRRKQ